MRRTSGGICKVPATSPAGEPGARGAAGARGRAARRGYSISTWRGSMAGSR
jgi:hypothetical protein